MNLPPGPKSPYFWQLLQILFNPTDSLDKWSKKYGDTLKLGGNKKPYTVSFSSPDAIQAILTASPEAIGSVQKSELVKTLLGDSSLIFLPEQEHQRQRKLILPSFHKESLENCGREIVNVTKNTMLNLTSGDSFEVRSTMKKISLKVILYSIFGTKDSFNDEQISQTIIKIFNRFDSPQLACYLLTARFIPIFLNIEIGVWKTFKQLQQKLDILIEAEIIKQRESPKSFEKNLLSLLLLAKNENKQSLTEREIRDAIMTLIFAGFETAAAAMSWMLYWVHYIPEVREKLLDELVFPSDNIEPMAVVRLPYLGAICNETLRITPPALSAFSRTVKQKIKIGKYDLEPNTKIDVSIYLAHRRKSVYPEPNKFNPERFLQNQFSPYEYLPFGGGQCRCLGASLAQFEMKIVLATIMTNFELQIVKPKPLKPKRHGIVMIPPQLSMKITQKK
ncbi:Cytochrome P450 superfamily [Hyella patelloides LEGE 07179]|uniref:Cytochrome P450 superfamily n=1 Tax=Hyella patelloides LEGE 07179 TaxID=945734 RepID=A0A563VLS4_9CYAN|nr:cytochrome P450 [Hyella patelloides]VEP12400.1 Cytochrome P450 superfamily [Hyella patelloides LEGE 07179]